MGRACAKVQTVKAKNGTETGRQRLLPGLSVKDGFTRHPFDVEFGVRTSGLVAGRHLKSGHRHDRHSTAYYGVAPSVFHALIKRWQKSRPAAAIEEITFVDVGAGMGRAVLLAAEMPFKAVVGVELHPTLAGIARRNATVWQKSGRARAPIKIVLGDAIEFKWPAGPCLAFLFNPFGETVMRRMVKSWRKSFAERAGELDILYVNNEQERALEGHLGLNRLFLGEVERSRADAIADYRILSNQPDGEYASSNAEDCSIWRR
jgi:SAM-dependent methyltransferase